MDSMVQAMMDVAAQAWNSAAAVAQANEQARRAEWMEIMAAEAWDADARAQVIAAWAKADVVEAVEAACERVEDDE